MRFFYFSTTEYNFDEKKISNRSIDSNIKSNKILSNLINILIYDLIPYFVEIHFKLKFQ